MDGLPLAEGLDSDKDSEIDQYKTQAKSLFKKLCSGGSQPNRMTIESGKYLFHYLIENGVCFLTLTEKGYPKKLGFQYLEELSGEFSRLYGTQVETVTRPYAFIKFDTFIQKTKKLYMDTRTQRNLAKLNEDLAEVHAVMTKNIQEVLGQGDKLDKMTRLSNTLSSEAKYYAKGAKNLHNQALLKKYLPLGVVLAIVILVLWVRSAFY